jgi:hypothetical protein
LKARAQLLEDKEPLLEPELEALRDLVKETCKQVIAASPELPDELQVLVSGIPDLAGLADFVGAMMPGLTFTERQGLLTEL